jgi:hypothetical protein
MDPIVLAALQKLVIAQQNAKKAGDELPPDAIDSFLKEETKGTFGLKDLQKIQGINPTNLGISGVQGASFNFGDELLNAVDPKHQAGAEMKTRQALFHNEHPYIDDAAGLVGGLATGGAFGKLLKGLGLLGDAATVGDAAVQGAKGGAAGGALYGAGSGDDLKSRVEGAALGGASGAVGGGLLGGAVGGAVAASRGAPLSTGRLVAAIRKEGGLDAVQARLKVFVDAGRGDQVTLADLGPHLRAALDFSANASDNVLVPATELLQARTAERAARVLADVRANLGAPASLLNPRPNMTPDQVRSGEPDAALRARQLQQNKSDVGAEAYGALAAKNPEFDVTKLPLNKPLISRLWSGAKLAGDINAEGSPIDELIAKLTKANPAMKPAEIQQAAQSIAAASSSDAVASGLPPAFSPKERPVGLDDMTSLYRALEGRAKAAFKAGNGALGNSLAGVKTEVGNTLEAGAPGFKEAQAAYRGANDLERGLDEGHDWWMKADHRELARVVAAKANQPGALAEFRTGIASGLVEKLQAAATNQDVARQIMQGSEDMNAKLKLIFGDSKTFDNFMSRAKVENEMSKMSGALYNSATARRLAAQGVNASDVALDAALSPGKASSKVLAAIGKHTTGVINRRTADAMGPQLLTQGASNIDELLRQFGVRPLLTDATKTFAASSGLMSLFSH